MEKSYNPDTQKSDYLERGSGLPDLPPEKTTLKFLLAPEDYTSSKPVPEKPKKRFKEVAKSIAKYIGERTKKINLAKYFGRKRTKKIKTLKVDPKHLKRLIDEETRKGNEYDI